MGEAASGRRNRRRSVGLKHAANQAAVSRRPRRQPAAHGGAQGSARETRARRNQRRGAQSRSRIARSKASSANRKRSAFSRVTDGEFRRISWNYDFLEQLDNVESYVGERKIKFTSGGPQPRPILLRVIGKLGGYKPHPMIEHFKFLKAHTRQTAKVTIPSPSSLHFRYGRDAVPESIYPSMDDFYRDLGETYRKVVRAFADAGCRYLQLDEVNLAYLCDPSLARAHHGARRRSGGAAGNLCRHDQCGDRRYPRRHDDHHASVPRQFSLELCRQRRLRAGRRSAVQRHQGARLLHGVRQRPRRRFRAAALRAEGQDRRARARHQQNRNSWKAATRSNAGSSRRRNSCRSISFACRRNAALLRPRKATSCPRTSNGRSCG